MFLMRGRGKGSRVKAPAGEETQEAELAADCLCPIGVPGCNGWQLQMTLPAGWPLRASPGLHRFTALHNTRRAIWIAHRPEGGKVQLAYV